MQPVCLRALRASPAAAHIATARQAAHSRWVVPARRFTAARAQAAGEGDTGDKPAPAQEQHAQEQRALAPRGAFETSLLTPSWGRMNQMFKEMEHEMAAISSAFGLPSMLGPSTGLLDALPSVAAELPAVTSKSLAVDIKDTGSALVVHADVPGMTKEDIRVQVSPDRVLSISGERRSETKEGSEEEGHLRVERSFGSFMRRFQLPENADVSGIKASTKDGVLTLTIPKTEAAKPEATQIPVSSE